LRHRRRNNTQKILRQTTGTYTKFSPPKKKKSKKPLVYILLIIIIIISGAYFYGDAISEMYTEFSKNTVTENNVSAPAENPKTEKQSIPANGDKNNQKFYTPIEKKIQLEILNGCGETGVAKKLTDLLKKSNYDIVNSGNYIQRGKINWDVNESKIIDQMDKQDEARKLADIMGILYSNVETFENPSPIADLTIVIGKDYKTLAIFQ